MFEPEEYIRCNGCREMFKFRELEKIEGCYLCPRCLDLRKRLKKVFGTNISEISTSILNPLE